MSLRGWECKLVWWSQRLLFVGISLFGVPAVMALPPSLHLPTAGIIETHDESPERLTLVRRGGWRTNRSPLVVSPTTLAFSGEGGSPTSTDQSFTIRRRWRWWGSTSWSVSSTTPWLAVTPGSGTTSRETDVVTVKADPSQLAPGTYEGVITVAVSGTTGLAEVKVTMTVVESQASPPTISQSPASLTFAAEEGAPNPNAQLLSIQNTGGGTLGWSLTENAAWLHLGATSGTTTSETDSVNVSVDTVGLPPGTYVATVTLAAQDASNSPLDIPVSLAVAKAPLPPQEDEPPLPPQEDPVPLPPQEDPAPPPPPVDTTARLSWDPNSEDDLAGYNVYMGTASGEFGPPTNVGMMTSLEIHNLTLGNTYYFTVTAVDTSGNESPPAAERTKSIY